LKLALYALLAFLIIQLVFQYNTSIDEAEMNEKVERGANQAWGIAQQFLVHTKFTVE